MLTNEHIIQSKINCFKAGIYDVLSLSDKQIEAISVLCDQYTDELLFGGAAGGAKTWTGCEWLLWSCLSYPGTRWFVGRHHLSQIRESTVETFKKVCKKHGIPQSSWRYNEQTVKITFENGSVIKGIEMMQRPSDLEFDAFGSTEYTGGWIEEGGGVTYKAYEVAGTRIGRHLNDKYGIRGKLLITGNPSRNWMYTLFYKPWRSNVLPVVKRFIQALVGDNKFRESGYEDKLSRLTGATRERLFLGNWDFLDDPLALCDFDSIQDFYTNDFVKPNPHEKYLILDIAMMGKDLLRGAVFYGDVLEDHDKMKRSGGAEVLQFAKRLQAKHRIMAHNILYDSDGIGAFLGGDGGFIPGAIPFHALAQPFIINADKTTGQQKNQKSEYQTLRDQCGYLLANDINEGKMWGKAVVSQDDREMLTEELSYLKKAKEETDGKLRIMSKEIIKPLLGRSPDFLDILLMKKYYDLKKLSEPKQFTRKIRAF